MADDELNFANDAMGAVDYSSRSSAWLVLLLIGLTLAAAIGWASWAVVQQVTTGEGKIIPSSHVQVVESLEPGIVAQIMVKEGDKVKKSQPLLRIDDTGSSSRLGELHRKQAAINAELHRLNAHIAKQKTYQVPTDVAAEDVAFYQNQSDVFLANRRRLDEQVEIRKKQLQQKKQAYAEAVNAAKSSKVQLQLANRELKLIRRLYKRKAVPEIDLIRVQKQSAKLNGDLKTWKAAKLRLQAEIDEAELLIGAEESVFLAEVSTRASKISAEISIVEQTMRAASDAVRRAILRSPVDGIINKLNVAGLNEVVKAGTAVAEIVPIGDTLLVEVKIRPEDVGFIRPGLPATIRVTAYDYTRYGTLTGKVERIAADTTTERDNQTFYRVIVSRQAGDNDSQAEKLDLIPGMVATVDITTGDRTVLDYLMKPILVLKERALRDPR